MKEWMAQADPPKEANTVKKLKGRPLLLSSKKNDTFNLKNERRHVVL